MNEVEKMYSNAGIKPLCQIPDEYCGLKNVYEDFTPEKQLELIKWLINEVDYITLWHFNNPEKPYDFDLGRYNSGGENFEDALAQMVNNLWQDLTNAEKAQIKEILE